MNFRLADLHRVNSATKYPSIPTYHRLGEKGHLQPDVGVSFDDERVVVTEKIDGTNTRIILSDGSYAVGSREHLLTVDGDVLYDPAQGIVEKIRGGCHALAQAFRRFAPGYITILYCEFYGGRVTASSKNYAADGVATGLCLFDVSRYQAVDFEHLLASNTPEQLARKRDAGLQLFEDEASLREMSAVANIPLVHRFDVPSFDHVPTDVEATVAWMRRCASVSKSTLDERALGKPEGVVVRTYAREKIAKLRFEDYERTLSFRIARGR
jgi:hypothetical protein